MQRCHAKEATTAETPRVTMVRPSCRQRLGTEFFVCALANNASLYGFDHASLSAETLLRMCDIANTMCSLNDESSLGSRLSFNAHTLLRAPRGPATATPPQGQD